MVRRVQPTGSMDFGGGQENDLGTGWAVKGFGGLDQTPDIWATNGATTIVPCPVVTEPRFRLAVTGALIVHKYQQLYLPTESDSDHLHEG